MTSKEVYVQAKNQSEDKNDNKHEENIKSQDESESKVYRFITFGIWISKILKLKIELKLLYLLYLYLLLCTSY